MSDLPDQQRFAELVPILILTAYARGYKITYGDAWAHPEDERHVEGSYHYRRLAIDLNLFRNGVYLRRSEDHAEMGAFWKSLDPKCSWGGDFPDKDGNHYSYGEGIRGDRRNAG